ncbi:MAG: LuxR C-terminal-related transcriptional regulator [Bacteroidota bacterium]
MHTIVLISEKGKATLFRKYFSVLLKNKKIVDCNSLKQFHAKSWLNCSLIIIDRSIFLMAESSVSEQLNNMKAKCFVLIFFFNETMLHRMKSILVNNKQTNGNRKMKSGQGRKTSGSLFTKREIEVMQLMIKGMSYQHIADTLFISRETIISHIKHIYEKLNVKKMSEAVAKIINEKII